MTARTTGYEYYSYITVISCIYHGKHHVRLLPGPQDRLSALGPHQRRDAGVCGRALTCEIAGQAGNDEPNKPATTYQSCPA